MSQLLARQVARLTLDAEADHVERGNAALDALLASIYATFSRGVPSDLALAGFFAVYLNALAVSLAAAERLVIDQAFTAYTLGRRPAVQTAQIAAQLAPGLDALRLRVRRVLRSRLTTPAESMEVLRRQSERGFLAQHRASLMASAAASVNPALHDAVYAATQDQPALIFGAYNPLDQRTEALDRALCLNDGKTITTRAGRPVRSIPGVVGKYEWSQVWMPGAPEQGGDTHFGCRCVLVPEERES